MTEVLTQAPDSPEVGRAGAPLATVQDDPRTHAYSVLFDRIDRSTEPKWLGALRGGAIERFGQLGFPTRKDEDWHFTNVAPISDRSFTPNTSGVASQVTREQLAPFLFDGDWATMVFVNGQFSKELSDYHRGNGHYFISTLKDAIENEIRFAEQHLAGLASYQANAFVALNTAFMQNGAFIALSANVAVEKPIHLLYVTDESAEGSLISPRTLILADHHSEVTVVESYVSLSQSSTYLTNAVSEVYLSPGSRVTHYKVQRESMAGYHVGSTYAYQQADSNYESFSFATGADLSRTNISTVLDGEGGHATLNGLYMVDGKQVVDHQTRIEHAKESCTSHEMYKGVMDGSSKGVFNGKVYVRPEAQKTDGKQSNNNLLLSEKAEVNTKPQLEIFADDVRCTHGATIGQLDDTALFYLKSRGVGADMAKELLTYAFAAEVLEEMTIDSVKDQLEGLAFSRFAAK